MSNTLSLTAFVVTPLVLLLFLLGFKYGWVRRLVFPVLAVSLLLLTGVAAYKDNANRSYLAIQDQYRADYASKDTALAPTDSKVQQLILHSTPPKPAPSPRLSVAFRATFPTSRRWVLTRPPPD